MATEQEKIANRERVWSMLAVAMTKDVWDLAADSASSLTPQIGVQILDMIEKQLNLLIKGDTPEAVITSLGEMCVEGMGFAASAAVETNEKVIKLTLSGAEATNEFSQLRNAGVVKLFSHPFLCCGVAALAKIGRKCRGDVQVDANNRSTVITFDLI